MNCQEALDLLYDILDKEASQIDTHQVQEHLEKCKHCFERYKVEADVNAFIKQKLTNTAPVHVESLRVKILAQLDDIDREEGAVTGRKPPFWNTSVALAAAALLVISIGAAFLVAGFYRHHQLFAPLENAHFAAEQPAAFATVDGTNAALALATDTVGYTVNSSFMNYRLLGARSEDIQGAHMAHFVFIDTTQASTASVISTNASTANATSSSTGTNASHVSGSSDVAGSGDWFAHYPGRDHIVSVFVVQAASYPIPASLQKHPIDHNGSRFFDHHCRGCHLVYHRVGNALIITATTNHSTNLLDLVPGQAAI